MNRYIGDNSNSINLKPSYIIGIGASAGGLNPIKEVIGNLPDHIGDRAIIVAQHVSPNYKSMLVELIGRETKIPVKEAKNDMPIEPNTIYTTPSDNNIIIENGKFVLSKPLKTAAKPSIGMLFESIAKTYKEKSAGIVLSGTGKDGSQGIVAIKKHGGITLVQEPSSAKYENMPQSAIDTGHVDFVLPASIIGSELLHILSDPESYQLEHLDVDEEVDNTSVMKVLGLLTARMGTDIMRYKPSTIHRRLEIKESVSDPRVIELEHELAATKEHMNTLVQELETSNEELQALNEELQSSNEELQASNEELSEVNAYLENFVHVIAHDMRSPVANLKYLAEVFTSLDAEGQARYAPLISKSINKLDNTLNGLVQIIDIKGQHNTKIAEPIDISEVIEQVLEEHQNVINETGAKIYVKNNFPRKIIYIRGYLESILRNLISNSLKYRKKNQQPEIYLSVLPQDSFVFISVKDNGIGINLKTHGKKMFTPFNRFTEDTPGLGIGLHIIKTMVEKNGGSITVESKEGKGATFNVFLKEFQQG